MYKHILIPIDDDSKLAAKAISDGIALARTMKARITGFTALPEFRPRTEMQARSRQAASLADHEARSARKAQARLAEVTRQAATAGVDCDTYYVLDDRPDHAIVEAAGKYGCDLIVMASHGRRGLSALVNGSETRGVLSKSKVPTLVLR